MTYRHLASSRDGAVEHLTLDRPDVRNAFNKALIGELAAWAAAARKDESLRVVVLSGRGKVFSAGADLEWMSKTAGYTEDQYLRDASRLADMLASLDTLPQALVGRVHGAAIAGGIGLVSVCDIVIAEENTVFRFSEVNLGIVPAVISPYVVAKIGPSAARELFVTGRRFGAERARELGLVHSVVPASELDRAVESHLQELRSSAPAAVADAKTLVRSIFAKSPAEARDVASGILARRRASDEARAGMKALFEKKKPPWAE